MLLAPADSAKGLSSVGLADLLLTVEYLIYWSQDTNCEMLSGWLVNNFSRREFRIQESVSSKILISGYLLLTSFFASTFLIIGLIVGQ